MNTWNKQFSYSWGVWFAFHPKITAQQSVDYDPFWWKGFVQGTVDYWLMKKGLK